MSQFKVFLLGFSLVMGFMTVATTAEADQACVQECLAQNLASPATKRKISTGVLTRSQVVTILTRKCVEECNAEIIPPEEPEEVYRPPTVVDSEPETGVDGGEANDTAGTTDKSAEVVPAPPEPETLPVIVAPPSAEEKSAEIVSAVQPILDRKAEKGELEDLRLKVAALEKQIQGQQTRIENTGDRTEAGNGAEVPEDMGSAQDVRAPVKTVTAFEAESNDVVQDGPPIALIVGSILVVLACVAFILYTLITARRSKRNRIEIEERAEASAEDELPPPPPIVERRGVVVPPPSRFSSERPDTGTQVAFQHPTDSEN